MIKPHRSEIIGSGLLGNALNAAQPQIANTVFLAAGVSNSQSTDQNQFQREIDLFNQVSETLSDRRLVYLSSMSVYFAQDNPDAYTRHKLEMENRVSTLPHYAIFRLANVVGPISAANPNTIIQFLYRNLSAKKSFPVWRNAYRSLIDVEDVVKAIVKKLGTLPVEDNCKANIASCWLAVEEITNMLSKILEVESRHFLVERANSALPDSIEINNLTQQLANKTYVSSVLKKYYGSQPE